MKKIIVILAAGVMLASCASKKHVASYLIGSIYQHFHLL